MPAYLLDSSFVIDALNEAAAGEVGPALKWLAANRRAQLWISPVTHAEVIEGASDVEAARLHLGRYRWQGLHRAHAESVALLQRRNAARMGENDAWQVAVALGMNGCIVGHDPRAFSRLGAAYVDHRAS
jgi:predicted nucleic acid-binding protein